MSVARLYKPRVRPLWWLSRRTYTLFVLRELSSAFVAWTVVYLLLLVRAVFRGPVAYQRFLDWSASPWLIALNLVTVPISYRGNLLWSLAPLRARAPLFAGLDPPLTGARSPEKHQTVVILLVRMGGTPRPTGNRGIPGHR